MDKYTPPVPTVWDSSKADHKHVDMMDEKLDRVFNPKADMKEKSVLSPVSWDQPRAWPQ